MIRELRQTLKLKAGALRSGKFRAKVLIMESFVPMKDRFLAAATSFGPARRSKTLRSVLCGTLRRTSGVPGGPDMSDMS